MNKPTEEVRLAICRDIARAKEHRRALYEGGSWYRFWTVGYPHYKEILLNDLNRIFKRKNETKQ